MADALLMIWVMRCIVKYVVDVLINAYVIRFKYAMFLLNLYEEPAWGMRVLDEVAWDNNNKFVCY
jgi:hypothetical protein